MTFSEKIEKFRKRISGMSDSFADMTEEATKNALIMPFFTILGYDVFDPQEFVPEFVCDVGTKKGEKIDYAIMSDGEPIILIEAKKAGMKLQKQQQGQLYRYFSVNRARIAILTNGLQYNIYSDINSPNVMDDEPFFTFNILTDDPSLFLQSLEQFCKDGLDIPAILSEAVYLKYFSVVEKTFRQDLENPSDELVKYFLSRPEINSGKRITSHIINKYRPVTAEALRKVMGVTIAKTPETVSDESTQPVNEEAETSIPTSCQPVSDMLSALGKSGYIFKSEGKVHTFVFDKFRIVIPEHKAGRYVVFSADPSTIFFVHNIAELGQIINNICGMTV